MTKKPKKIVHVIPPIETLFSAMDELCEETEPAEPKSANGNAAAASGYRQQALKHYKREIAGVHVNVCVTCGFGIPAILEVAHLDQNRKNSKIENLAILCPNCHKMHDIGLIPTEVVKTMRDLKPKENWLLRIKDAGSKAAQTKRNKALSVKKSAAAKKAWLTRGSVDAVKSDKGA
jgi:hypothetical protein